MNHVAFNVIYVDGSVIYVDGSVIYVDGSVIYVEGNVIYVEGNVIYVEGNVIYAARSVIHVIFKIYIFLSMDSNWNPVIYVYLCTRKEGMFRRKIMKTLNSTKSDAFFE